MSEQHADTVVHYKDCSRYNWHDPEAQCDGARCGPQVRKPWSPRFGEPVENLMASTQNPLRIGLFVEVIKRPRGGANPGRWWRLTDGHGEFWLTNPANCCHTQSDGPACR